MSIKEHKKFIVRTIYFVHDDLFHEEVNHSELSLGYT